MPSEKLPSSVEHQDRICCESGSQPISCVPHQRSLTGSHCYFSAQKFFIRIPPGRNMNRNFVSFPRPFTGEYIKGNKLVGVRYRVNLRFPQVIEFPATAFTNPERRVFAFSRRRTIYSRRLEFSILDRNIVRDKSHLHIDAVRSRTAKVILITAFRKQVITLTVRPVSSV